ncbi:MAG: polyprenyl synthetase family protein [Planctomycetes bacterium]|nr:polyprenyl synthetase family protein [Planctomycetota bacterium]
MAKLSQRNVRPHEVVEGPRTQLRVGDPESNLAQVFHCVAEEMQAVEKHLGATLRDTEDPLVRQIVDFLLESPGKRIRPALVLLSAQAAGAGQRTGDRRQTTDDGAVLRPPSSVLRNPSSGPRAGDPWINVAVAVELIHMASLVHDDLIDNGTLRHHRSTIHARWGRKVSVFLGNHLCAKAFQLVAACADPRLFALLGAPLCAMCEGESQQVLGRGDFQMSTRRCLAITEKKTAALFGACSGAGALTTTKEPGICRALREFGLHFGIAFQVLDDCRDLLSDEKGLGKTPGQDLLAGDVTLPLLYVLRQCRRKQGPPTHTSALGNPEQPSQSNPPLGTRRLVGMSKTLLSSPVPVRIARVIAAHVDRAKQQLQPLAESNFKDSLGWLADHIAASASGILAR